MVFYKSYGKSKFFPSGGAGYFLSRGLIRKAAIWAPYWRKKPILRPSIVVFD